MNVPKKNGISVIHSKNPILGKISVNAVKDTPMSIAGNAIFLYCSHIGASLNKIFDKPNVVLIDGEGFSLEIFESPFSFYVTEC